MDVKNNIFVWVTFFFLMAPFCLCSAELPLTDEALSTTVVIKVGSGVRPPFLIDKNQHGFEGVGPEILQVFNQIQKQFHFVINEIPSKRKVNAVQDGKLDIMMWDNRIWGWGDSTKQSSSLVDSKDVYFTLKEKGREQRFFDDFTGKKIALVIGYHYKIADFSTDISFLSNHFDVTMVRTEEASIKMTMAGRVDIAVVSETALEWYLIRFPEYRSKILISDIYDTQYSRYFVLPANSPIKAHEINGILTLANKRGLLAPIYKKYGLVKPSPFLTD